MKKIGTGVWVFIGSLAVIIALFVFMIRGDFASRDNNIVSPEVASSQAISFIEENYTRGAVPIELIETVKESGIYKITLNIGGDQIDVFTTLDGKMFFPEGVDMENRVVFERAIGGFTKTDEEVCLENGKPIVYYFGRSECPFCIWQQPVITSAMEQFEGYVVFKDHTDTEEDMDVFTRYSEEGAVPLIVIGCNYFRLGAGGSEGNEESDKNNISALTCKLTGGQPQEVCLGLEGVIEQI